MCNYSSRMIENATPVNRISGSSSVESGVVAFGTFSCVKRMRVMAASGVVVNVTEFRDVVGSDLFDDNVNNNGTVDRCSIEFIVLQREHGYWRRSNGSRRNKRC